MFYQKYIKRILDIVVSLLGLCIAAIPMWIIAIVIVCSDPGTVIFSQKRAGMRKNGEETTFQMYKFRSMWMSTPADIPTSELEHPEDHITPVGKFLRKTSLDELPQLVNILQGDMSFVGPRPALYNQEDLLQLRQENGSDLVKPGLFGWAQMNGRDKLTVEQKAELDGEYVKRMSFWFDCRCLFGSVIGSILQKDIVEGKQKK